MPDDEEVRLVVSSPLFVRGEHAAAAYVFRHLREQAYDTSVANLFQDIADDIAVALPLVDAVEHPGP